MSLFAMVFPGLINPRSRMPWTYKYRSGDDDLTLSLITSSKTLA